MTQKRDSFQPDRVDEQIDQCSLSICGEQVPGQTDMQTAAWNHAGRVNPGKRTRPRQDVPAHLVRELQVYYQAELQHNQELLEHAWRRIAAHQSANHAPAQTQDTVSPSPRLKYSSQRIDIMDHQRKPDSPGARKFTRSMSLLAATLVSVVLVVLLVATLSLGHTHQNSTVATNKTPIPIPTATPLPVGAIIHTQIPPAGLNLYGLAWSPDGTRIASLTDDQQGLKSQLQI